MILRKRMIGITAIVALVACVIMAARGVMPDGTVDASTGQAMWLTRNVGTARDTIGFDVAAKRAQFILPYGLRSADGTSYWAPFHAGNFTSLHSFDLNTGTIEATLGLEGTWGLGAVSATGQWLALKRVPTEGETQAWTKTLSWKSDFVVIDANSGKTTRTFTLNGNLDVDALKADGSMLYLIEHLPALKPDHYQVRAYGVATGELLEGVIVDKRNIDEEMAGYPTDQVGSTNGDWLFTLYVGMREGHAFIHALSLKDGFAFCIDLPSGDGSEVGQANYALALAPDGHTIYASNAALGVLAVADVMNIGEVREIRFAPALTKFEATSATTKSSMVSPDGKTVFVSSGGTVWSYDVVTGKTQEIKRGLLPIIGMSWEADAKQLLVAEADHSIATVEASSTVTVGQNVSAIKTNPCPVTQRPATAFVPPAPYPKIAPYGQFWVGNAKLWTAVSPEGSWNGLPFYGGAYTQKVFWWSEGYSALTGEAFPTFKVTGKQLDGTATFVSDAATNATHTDFGGTTILTGVEIPAQGCWQLTGEYKGESLSFVVQVGK